MPAQDIREMILSLLGIPNDAVELELKNSSLNSDNCAGPYIGHFRYIPGQRNQMIGGKMQPPLDHILIVLAITIFAGCANTRQAWVGDGESTQEKKAAKTLFEWAVGGEEKNKGNNDPDDDKAGLKKKNDGEQCDPEDQQVAKKTDRPSNKDEDSNAREKNNGKNESEQEPPETDQKDEPLKADRPDFLEASSTVGKGRVQLESGYTFVRDRAGGTHVDSHSYPEALFRIGLFADWFEFRIGQNFSSNRTISTEVFQSTNGGEDLYLGTKLALTEQKKTLPEMALIVQMTVPTGHRRLTAGEVLPGFNWICGWNLIEDRLSLGSGLQVNRAIDDSDHAYVELSQAVSFGYTLSQRLGAYTEWFGFFPDGAVSPDVGPQHYFDAGFTYLITKNFQVDIRGGVGLNRWADDFFVGIGTALRR